jgi:hypothetical protein
MTEVAAMSTTNTGALVPGPGGQPPLPPGMLSPHFALAEFTASQTAARLGLPNNPPPAELANLQRLAATLETVRELLGNKPLLISSGYRSPEVNRATGGSSSSAHMQGLAVDFVVPGFGSALEICHALTPHMHELRIDQLIHEYGAWVHLALSSGDPRLMTLTIDTAGTRHGFA